MKIFDNVLNESIVSIRFVVADTVAIHCCCQRLETQGGGQGQGVKLQGQGQGLDFQGRGLENWSSRIPRTRTFLEDNNTVAIYLTAVPLRVFLDFIIKTVHKLSQLTARGEKSKNNSIGMIDCHFPAVVITLSIGKLDKFN